MILLPLMVPVAPALAAEHEECTNKAGHNHSSVDGLDAVHKAVDKAVVSERQYFPGSCCHRGNYSCQNSYFDGSSTTPALLGQTSVLSQYEVAISFFSATDHFFTNENSQPPLRPPIF
ncbi:MAG: hypothetical protein BMS9Abin25_0737 [Gammaproteobacteria bacterium]|nr:MAG: hypothetical protein BMS9Abin25_0737 [Gammaproteobacteria bacterium]